MASVTKERYGEFQYGVLKILSAKPAGVPVQQVLERLEIEYPANEFENSTYANGTRKRPFIVRFASIGIVKAGWIRKDKGVWSITEEGLDALNRFKTPAEIFNESNRRYQIWKQSQEVEADFTDEESSSIEASVSLEDAEAEAYEIMCKHMAQMNPYDFQDLVKYLLEGMGYKVSWVAPPGKDGGLDIIAFQDPLGTVGPRIKVQVKRQQGTVGVDVIRSFLGILSDKDDVGIFVSLGGFSGDAERETRMHNSKRVTLIDQRKLVDYWIANYDILSAAGKALMPIKPIYYLEI